MKTTNYFWALAIVCLALTGVTQAHDVAGEMTKAAGLFLASLDESQQASVQFEFDNELRKDWQFIPMERNGLGLKQMKPNQRLLAMSLIQSALSHRGFSTSMKIMALEQVLHEMENQSPTRDPEKYHLFLFGSPSADAPWGWRVEGHHLSVSVTIVDGRTVMTAPAFFGANPGEVRQGKLKGLRVLGTEEDLGRKLVKSLTIAQKQIAVLPGEAPSDVIFGPGRTAEPLEPKGIRVDKMNPAQVETLRTLISAHLGKSRSELAATDWEKIEAAGFEKIHFAWVGEFGLGKPHYYRVQGPTFILEYDNTQNQANHVHAVWRDFKNDFGEDLLQRHYQSVPHPEQSK